MAATTTTIATSNPRIPLALQTLFLVSNRLHSSSADDNEDDVESADGREEKTSRFHIHEHIEQDAVSTKRHLSTPSTSTSLTVATVSSSSEETYVDSEESEPLPLANANRIRKRNQDSPSLSSISLSSSSSPHDYLMEQLIQRGYSGRLFSSLDSAYYCRPTPLQQASYGTYITSRTVLEEDNEVLIRMLRAGISPNPCNKYGESLIHTVCRRGHWQALQILLHYGASLQVTDDYGRTPLHDACWRSSDLSTSFKIVALILSHDPNLIYMVDKRGTPPLEYIPKEQRQEWIKEFWSSSELLDRFWPVLRSGPVGNHPTLQFSSPPHPPPPLTLLPPHSRTIPDPRNALPIEWAAHVVSGNLTPNQLDAVAMARARAGAMGTTGPNTNVISNDDDEEEEHGSDHVQQSDNSDSDADFDANQSYCSIGNCDSSFSDDTLSSSASSTSFSFTEAAEFDYHPDNSNLGVEAETNVNIVKEDNSLLEEADDHQLCIILSNRNSISNFVGNFDDEHGGDDDDYIGDDNNSLVSLLGDKREGDHDNEEYYYDGEDEDGDTSDGCNNHNKEQQRHGKSFLCYRGRRITSKGGAAIFIATMIEQCCCSYAGRGKDFVVATMLGARWTASSFMNAPLGCCFKSAGNSYGNYDDDKRLE